MAILISEIVHFLLFRAKNITSDKEGHFTLIKQSIHQEDITSLKVYAPNDDKIQNV